VIVVVITESNAPQSTAVKLSTISFETDKDDCDVSYAVIISSTEDLSFINAEEAYELSTERLTDSLSNGEFQKLLKRYYSFYFDDQSSSSSGYSSSALGKLSSWIDFGPIEEEQKESADTNSNSKRGTSPAHLLEIKIVAVFCAVFGFPLLMYFVWKLVWKRMGNSSVVSPLNAGEGEHIEMAEVRCISEAGEGNSELFKPDFVLPQATSLPVTVTGITRATAVYPA
jgi:hypothetical protein